MCDRESNAGRYPHVLVISNNCFSTTGSNGRTLGGLFAGWPASHLAQFYISNEVPDSPVCDNYFRVTDLDAVKSVVLRWCSFGMVVERRTPRAGEEVVTSPGRAGIRKTAMTSLIRNAAWFFGHWPRRGLDKWISDFAPELVVFQAGDAPFMYRIALRISRKRGIPLVIYNSEDYYFKAHDYMSPEGGVLSRAAYRLFRWRLRAAVDEAMPRTALVVHLTDSLEETFSERFAAASAVIRTTATEVPRRDTVRAGVTRVTYLGNLGLDRHRSLIEVAAALYLVDPDICLDVYGRLPSERVREELNCTRGIRYLGFISYEETLGVMRDSDLLLHVESFAPFYREDIKHGFSTKIADSLASGTCLLVYAPPEMAVVSYLRRERAACVVTDEAALEGAIRQLLDELDLREAYVTRALEVAKRNHSHNATAVRFQSLLCGIADAHGRGLAPFDAEAVSVSAK